LAGETGRVFKKGIAGSRRRPRPNTSRESGVAFFELTPPKAKIAYFETLA
jgi:hypothetical protein